MFDIVFFLEINLNILWVNCRAKPPSELEAVELYNICILWCMYVLCSFVTFCNFVHSCLFLSFLKIHLALLMFDFDIIYLDDTSTDNL